MASVPLLKFSPRAGQVKPKVVGGSQTELGTKRFEVFWRRDWYKTDEQIYSSRSDPCPGQRAKRRLRRLLQIRMWFSVAVNERHEKRSKDVEIECLWAHNRSRWRTVRQRTAFSSMTAKEGTHPRHTLAFLIIRPNNNKYLDLRQRRV